MKVKELKRLLSYFSDDLEVCIEDQSSDNMPDSIKMIESAIGESLKVTGQFIVKLKIEGLFTS